MIISSARRPHKSDLSILLSLLLVETPLLTADFVHPNPKMGYAKLEDVVSAFVGSITDTDEKTNFTAWLIPDEKGVYRMETSGYL